MFIRILFFFIKIAIFLHEIVDHKYLIDLFIDNMINFYLRNIYWTRGYYF